MLSAALTLCPIGQNQLSDLPITYWGFDHQTHVGTLVINKAYAKEISQVFNALYEAKFPIDKIKPLSDYNYNENLAMQDDDTYSYNCRYITGSTHLLSKHSYGAAIDINPLYNPYINKENKIILPERGEKYAERNLVVPGMILNNDVVVKTFEEYGWAWGGEWKSLKDYQHFEKN